MDIRYIGPIDRVTVPLPTGGALEVDQGDVLTVPDDLGEKLLEQATNWAALVDADATNDELRAELAKHSVTAPAKATKAELLSLLDQALARVQAGITDPPPPPDTDPAGNGDAN